MHDMQYVCYNQCGKYKVFFFFLRIKKKKSSGKYKVSVIQNMQCIMFCFIVQNLCKSGIILDSTYLLLNLPNINYAQLFIKLKRVKSPDNKKLIK